MRRWNGWGDDHQDFEIPEGAQRLLKELVGRATPPTDVTLSQVMEQVPESRLPEHQLVSDDRESRVRHSRGQSFPDWLDLRSGRLTTFPDGVATPETSGQVRDLLHYAEKTGARLIPYGGGTSVLGHINALPSEEPVLVVDLQRMSKLRHLDLNAHLATFGAGVAGPELERQLAERGLTLGHFPQSFELSTLGGWIVTRSSGQQSMRYGRIEDLFAGGRFETPAGTLELPPHPASAAGPDLRQLVLGSEGRLGVVTEATVRVSPLPEFEEFHSIFFRDWEQASAAVREIAQARLGLSMLRLSTPKETQITLALAGHKWLISGLERILSLRGMGEEKCMLMVGATGNMSTSRAALKEVLYLAGNHGGWHLGQAMGKAWHKNRFHAPYARNSLWEAGYGVDTLETAIPWSGLDGLIRNIEYALNTALEDEEEKVHVFTHLSALYPTGTNVYTTYVFHLADDPEVTFERWKKLKGAVSEAIVEAKATISHQHGVGTDHLDYLAAEKGELGMKVLGDLCQRFDPSGLMNPGKLIRTDPRTGDQ